MRYFTDSVPEIYQCDWSKKIEKCLYTQTAEASYSSIAVVSASQKVESRFLPSVKWVQMMLTKITDWDDYLPTSYKTLTSICCRDTLTNAAKPRAIQTATIFNCIILLRERFLLDSRALCVRNWQCRKQVKQICTLCFIEILLQQNK